LKKFNMAKKSILVIGSANTDMIIQVERLPKPGETILGGQFSSAAGGKGANQAVGAARAGGVVTFIARVGQDVFGENALAGFIADKINVDYVVRDETAPTGVALIFVGKNGENSIAVASGANSLLNPLDVRRAKNVFREASVVLLQLETPLKTVQAAAELAFENGTPIILNPAPAQPLPANLLKRIFLITPNETEAEMLTGITVNNDSTAAKAAEKLMASGVQNVIVTMGSRGLLVVGKNLRCFLPAYSVKAVDTTAAGDIFNGTLAVALAEGKSLVDAARFANAAAAISVTRLGAQMSAPIRREIEKMLATREAIPNSTQRKLRNGWVEHSSIVAQKPVSNRAKI
jgi:ribokinase